MKEPLEIIRDKEEGNTKLPPQSLQKMFYCFTAFPKEETDENLLIERLKEISNKFIIGKEICPTTQKKHLQGFFILKKRMRPTELKLPMKPHVEACKGDESQNVKYCSKEGDVYKYGFPTPIKTIELRLWQQNILHLCKQEPNDRSIHWFHENVGNFGKSAFCKYMVVNHNAVFCSSGKYADLINLVFNSDMDKSRIVIFDIPRTQRNKISYEALESIKNGLVCNTKYETGTKVFNSPHIIVFANYPPRMDMLSSDRLLITELRHETLKVSLTFDELDSNGAFSSNSG